MNTTRIYRHLGHEDSGLQWCGDCGAVVPQTYRAKAVHEAWHAR